MKQFRLEDYEEEDIRSSYSHPNAKLHNRISNLIEENEQLRMKVIQLEDLVQTLISNNRK